MKIEREKCYHFVLKMISFEWIMDHGYSAIKEAIGKRKRSNVFPGEEEKMQNYYYSINTKQKKKMM